AETLLRVDHVSMDYGATWWGRRRHRDRPPALRDVCLELRSGETPGIVGESGSGKSTLARIIMGLLRPTSGNVYYRGHAVASMNRAQRAQYRRQVQMVFQHPETSVSPRLRVEQIIAEAWIANPDVVPRARRPERVRELL